MAFFGQNDSVHFLIIIGAFIKKLEKEFFSHVGNQKLKNIGWKWKEFCWKLKMLVWTEILGVLKTLKKKVKTFSVLSKFVMETKPIFPQPALLPVSRGYQRWELSPFKICGTDCSWRTRNSGGRRRVEWLLGMNCESYFLSCINCLLNSVTFWLGICTIHHSNKQPDNGRWVCVCSTRYIWGLPINEVLSKELLDSPWEFLSWVHETVSNCGGWGRMK